MYTDLLTKIHNAQRAKKATVKVPYSNMDMAIAEVLADKGFILAVSKKGRAPKRVIEVELKYDGEKGAISEINFVSVPSRRIYSGYKELRPIRQGFGLAVVSTSKGIMTASEARKQKVGGQRLFEIW
jgi:small subunit ribosomal protein S8